MQETTELLTFGEKLVGVQFNPSNDDKVAKAKQLFAQLANLTHDHYCRDGYSQKSDLEVQIYNHTIGEILNAQMNVVKLLTLKY